jgi:signal transduction histidine kinase/CheY-like chemotaxis protein
MAAIGGVGAGAGGGGDTIRGYVLAGLLCAAAATVLYPLQPAVPGANSGLALGVFSVAVAGSAWFGGTGPAVFSTALGALTGLAFAGGGAALAELERESVLGLTAFLLMGAVVTAGMRRLRRRAIAERAAREQAERALRHTTHLQELTSALSRARTPADVQRASLVELTHALVADAAVFAMVSEDGATCHAAWTIGVQHHPDATSGARLMSARTPLTDAIRRQELMVLESPEVGDLEYPDRRTDHLFAACESAVVVPLLKTNRAFGAIAFSFAHPRAFEGDERQFLWASAGRITQALDRAHVYETTEHARAAAEAFRMRADAELRERQRAEELLRESEAKYRSLATRTNRLYELNAGLSEAVSVEAVARVIVLQGKAVVGASGAGVSILVEGGNAFETLYADPLASEAEGNRRRYQVAEGLLATRVVQTRQPVFVTSFTEWQKQFPRSANAAADGGFASATALPLLIESSVMGVLLFTFTAPVNFDAGYSTLLLSVAQHCAQALDRARLYESTQAARTAAEEANRSKDEFLSTVSHELRTPLNAMLGWASLLRNGSLDPSRTTRAIEAVFNNATRQAHLIEELLDVSRIVAGRAPIDPQPLDLADNIRGAVEAIMPLADAKGLDVVMAPLERVTLHADPRRLEQVFLNVLSNAVKFTPSGGRVTVDMTAGESTVEVKVSDTGAGIDPAFIPFVFERFRQADSTMARSVGGLGLGLFIARHLVEAHDGRITVRSDGPGRGATFTVTMPLLEPRRPGAPRSLPAPVHARDDSAPSLAGLTVLLVDDEADTREVLGSALETYGATVLTANSAADALHALGAGTIDVLLADLAMPGADGYDLIRAIRAQPGRPFAGVPAAAVTASAHDDERQRAIDAGFQLHLAKPVRPEVLARTVAALARARRPAAGATSAASRPAAAEATTTRTT